jgi:hypothetical protein
LVASLLRCAWVAFAECKQRTKIRKTLGTKKFYQINRPTYMAFAEKTLSLKDIRGFWQILSDIL